MAEPVSARRVMRRPAVKSAFGVGDTKLDELERDGIVPKRFPLWPGSHIKGWWEDEVIAAQQRIAESAAAKAQSAPPKADTPRPKTALLKRMVRR